MWGSSKKYYCLVAGLKEYTLDSEKKGLDGILIKEEIYHALSKKDKSYVDLLYNYYDIENIINIKAGRNRFSLLGKFSEEQLREELKKPEILPDFLKKVLIAYEDPDNAEENGVNLHVRFEQSLLEAYYLECSKSDCKFVREWSEFDRNIRNISAALIARKTGLAVSGNLVGEGEISDALLRSSAVDFGLKNETPYIDTLINIITGDEKLTDKEYAIDKIRWDKAEEIASLDYFNINALLSYLVRINILSRWMLLDKERGREIFEKLVESLGNREIINGK